MKIRDLPIDKQVIDQLAKEGLDELYPPQQHAIEAGVLNGKNLVLASPTASGKTLVAELCILRHILEHRGKTIYLAPLRALASEKFKEFQRYSSIKKPNGDYVRAGISTGDYDSSDPWLGRYDIILCTNEKADSLLRHKAPWMSELTLVVADEVHLLTEQNRGPTLEVVLTRLTEINPNIQVLALSATVRNAEEVGSWLKAGSVTTDWRPVPLREGIYHDNQVQFRDGASRAIVTGTKTPSLDIALDVLSTGGQALIFTETRRSAVEMGRKASVAVKSRLSKPEERALSTLAERILSTGEKTRLSEALAMQVAAGAGFHHAGLAGIHRGIVEDAFREGRIKVLAATPTLCLPAGEEIFGNPGPIAIEKLSSYNKVLTHGNVFENVIAPTFRWYDGPLVKVTPWSQLPMRMTPEHNVLRVIRTRHSSRTLSTSRHWWTYSRPQWIAAKSLRIGDLVLFPRINEELDLRYLDLSEQGPSSNQFGTVGKHWSRLKIARLELTPQTLEVLGLYLAEGYTGRQGQVMFALNTKETDLTSVITDWLIGIGLRPRVVDGERRRRVVRACSRQLAETLRALCGQGAIEKRIPHQLMYLPNNQLAHVVRGMWRGDGNITESGARTARYSTVSRGLAKQLFAVLVKLGYMASIKMSKRAGISSEHGLTITHKHDLYTVSLSGKQLTRFLGDVLGVKSEKFSGNREFDRGYLDSNFYYMPIRTIEQEPYQGTVHNLEVNGHSSYVGSFVVHNSAGVNLPARAVVISSFERYEAGYGRYPISVLEYKQFCLPSEVPITLENGLSIPIGRIVKDRVGDKVLSVSNPHGVIGKPITGYFERETDELVEVGTAIGRTLTATPEHPVLAKGADGAPAWVPIQSIRTGDYLGYARDIPTSERQVYWVDFLPQKVTYVIGPIGFFNKKSIPLKYKVVARQLGVSLKTFKSYTSARRNPPLSVVLSLGGLLGLNKRELVSQIRLVKSKWGKPVRIPEAIDESFMWLVGIIASDGHVKKSRNIRGDYYHIRVFNKNRGIIEKARLVLQRLGCHPRITSRQDQQFTVEVGSNLLGLMISQFGIPFKKKSLDILVPDFLLQFPRRLIGAFLAGVFDGDGSYSETKHPRGINAMVRAIVIATGSNKFAWGVHELLLRLGIVSAVIKDDRVQHVMLNNRLTTFPNPVYRVTIRKISDIQKFSDLAKSVKRVPKIDYSKYHDSDIYRSRENAQPYSWVRVNSIVRKKLLSPRKVYNLSVNETETYLASNFIVHNCGRAGRPKYDKFGEALLIARNPDEAEWLMENYVLAQPEKLWSKLAAERVLRPHVLSTIAAGYAHSEEGLYSFFARTFYAHQYGPRLIKTKIGDILRFLFKEKMVLIEGKDLSATKFGKRVSELYIDPMSAVILRDGLYNRAKKMTDLSILHLISKTPDLAPRPRLRGGEVDKLGLLAEQRSDEFTYPIPTQFEDPVSYEEFLGELKAAQVLSDWIDERTEDQILETRKVEPGDLLRLVQGSEWLILATQELGRLFGHKDLLAPLEMLKVRLAKGVRPELVKLTTLEGVGRVRARMLYDAGLKSIDDIKERSLEQLMSIRTIGPSLAKRIKEQAGGLIKADEWEKAKKARPSDAEQQVVLTEYEDSE